MIHGIFNVPPTRNEPVQDHAPGSTRRASLEKRLKELGGESVEIPLVIGGERVKTGRTGELIEPHDHKKVLGTFHQAEDGEVEQAIGAAAKAYETWSEMPFEARAAIFLRAADLLTGPWRDTMNAVTMMNQSKTIYQSEIDAVCELADFWRFNVAYAERIYRDQPQSPPGQWNRLEYRPLEGFVFAITPFNFTSIGGNLPTAPALMGNTVLWKPASTAVYAAWVVMQVLEEAGLPAGVINFIPGSGRKVGDPVLAARDLAGVHFTGSTGVFRGIWRTIGGNIEKYKSYPRIVGETGGKDYVFAHPSCDAKQVATALTRGAFEYQGQKCSAASRAFLPASRADEIKKALFAQLSDIKMGDPKDLSNFMSAVIDKDSFENIKGYIDAAKSSSDAEIVFGGECDDSVGYFVQPTVIEAKDPRFKTMCEEIFGPVLTLWVYDDAKMDDALDHLDNDTEYALTGAIFARDRAAVEQLGRRLRHTAGNFYINDKPTGAVVSQQPFGGARGSGTNDKAGSWLNLIRWASPRTIKETFVPPTDYGYPHMG
ncbi:MAG: L-glutamate gamma-semialdehyde dehydrogenase [Planctomycetota bacterium]